MVLPVVNTTQRQSLDLLSLWIKDALVPVSRFSAQAAGSAKHPAKSCKTPSVEIGALMAKGYWNVSGAITNPEGMGPYIQAVEPYLAKCGARFLCRDLKTDVREGNAGHLTVIIEFESLAAAKAAYEAPEYQEMLKLRQPHSDVSLSIIEEGDHAGH